MKFLDLLAILLVVAWIVGWAILRVKWGKSEIARWYGFVTYALASATLVAATATHGSYDYWGTRADLVGLFLFIAAGVWHEIRWMKTPARWLDRPRYGVTIAFACGITALIMSYWPMQ